MAGSGPAHSAHGALLAREPCVCRHPVACPDGRHSVGSLWGLSSDDRGAAACAAPAARTAKRDVLLGTAGGGGGRDALEGKEVPPPPSRAPSLCPATVSLTPSASFSGIGNRQ